MSNVDCAKKAAPAVSDATIEEVSAKQLERLLEDKDYVAVYWCKCPVEVPGNLENGGFDSVDCFAYGREKVP